MIGPTDFRQTWMALLRPGLRLYRPVAGEEEAAAAAAQPVMARTSRRAFRAVHRQQSATMVRGAARKTDQERAQATEALPVGFAQGFFVCSIIPVEIC